VYCGQLCQSGVDVADQFMALGIKLHGCRSFQYIPIELSSVYLGFTDRLRNKKTRLASYLAVGLKLDQY